MKVAEEVEVNVTVELVADDGEQSYTWKSKVTFEVPDDIMALGNEAAQQYVNNRLTELNQHLLGMAHKTLQVYAEETGETDVRFKDIQTYTDVDPQSLGVAPDDASELDTE
jgi:hypothetical protein